MKQIAKKNRIFTEVGILLLAAIIIISTAAATATTPTSSTSMNIEEESVSSTTTISDTLLEEGFEDGQMPPSGWTHINSQDPPYTWHIVDSTDADVGVHDGNYAAAVKRYHISSQDEWLISPELDLSGYEEATLEFWAASWTWNPSATVKVIIRGDGIDDEIWDMINDEVWETVEYRIVILDLSNYVGETITICFQYVGIQGWHFGLDDVLVYGGEEPDPPELEIGNISGGWAGFGNGGKVSVEIKNIAGSEAEDATDVEWSITATGRGILQEINESGSGAISVIAPGDFETTELVVGRHFGRLNITVTAYEPHFDILISESVNGFIFIGYVFILNG